MHSSGFKLVELHCKQFKGFCGVFDLPVVS